MLFNTVQHFILQGSEYRVVFSQIFLNERTYNKLYWHRVIFQLVRSLEMNRNWLARLQINHYCQARCYSHDWTREARLVSAVFP